jgi:hypothetical protein
MRLHVVPQSLSWRVVLMTRFLFFLLLVICTPVPALAGLRFQFDYRYDRFGFFDDLARRESLEAAGRVVTRYVDELSALVPEGDNGWDAFVTRPDGGGSLLVSDLPIPQDTMLIFVGGNNTPGILAQSTDLAPVGSGDPEWRATVKDRGQVGAADRPPTDVGPSGGTISFNNNLTEVPWHFGLSVAGLEAGEFDFITVAAHELIHLLGFGLARSFDTYVNAQGQFIGPEAVAVGSTTNLTLRLDEGEAHWRSGTKSPWNGQLQEALLAPGIYAGRRALPTLLDRAALRDIGWEEASPGDANLDRFFDTKDLVQVLTIGKYETGRLAGWTEGDWDDNGLFDTNDLVAALQTGTYEQGVQDAFAKGVPEPSWMLLWWTAIVLLIGIHRRKLSRIG